MGQTPCLLVFEGTPSLLPEAQRSLFNYFVLDISGASDEYDIETSVFYATGYGKAAPDRLLLAVTPDGTLTDYNGVTRNAIAGAAYGALNMETPLGGIAWGFTISLPITTILILFINRPVEVFNS